MAGEVGPTVGNPKWDMSLSDGSNTVYMNYCDRNGHRISNGIKRTPYPRMSTKIASGATDNKYSDLQPPYYAVNQSNWSGGRGSLTFEDDTTRYLDSYRAWTDQENQIVLGGQETYCTTPRNCNQSMPGDVTWFQLTTDIRLAHSFTAGANYTASGAMLWVKYTGTPGDLIVEIWTDDGSDAPNALIAGATSSLSYTAIEAGVSQVRYFAFTTGPALTSGTKYWVVARTAADSTWFVGVNPDAGTATKKWRPVVTWAAAANELWYRVVDNQDLLFRFFEYKRQVYAVTMHVANPKIYINGDRGVADDNTGGLTKLNDATKTWTNDEWIGCIVLITKGSGSQEEQPWRIITDNDGTSLTVSSWKIIHDATTEYVILGSNKWTQTYAFATASPVVDVAVADEIVYFARDGANILRHAEYNVAGVWTGTGVGVTEAIATADRLLAINSPDGWMLWGGINNDSKHKTAVWKAKVPKSFETSGADLYTEIVKIEDCKSPWDEQVIANVTNTTTGDDVKVAVAGAFTTGTVCTKAIPPTDFTKGSAVGIYIKSDIGTNLGDLRFIYDDTPYCLHHYIPDNLWHYDTEILPSKLYHYKNYGRPTSIYYYDADAGGTNQNDPLRWHLMYNGRDNNAYTGFKCTLTANDYLYISTDQPANYYILDIDGTVKNNNAAVISAEYWDGDAWAAIAAASVTDTTENPAGTTLAQDGVWAFTIPVDWNPGCEIDTNTGQGAYLAMDQWHIRFKASADLDEVEFMEINYAGADISEYPEAERWVNMSNASESRYADYPYTATFYDHDRIYVCSPKRFDTIKVLMGATINAIDSNMTLKVWDGSAWVAHSTGYTDGTAASSHTLGITANTEGSIVFTMPDFWEKGCAAHQASVLGNDVFVAELCVHVTEAANYHTTNSVDILRVMVEDSSSEDIFEWVAMPNIKDGDTTTYDSIKLTADDWFYVMYPTKFNQVIWDGDTTFNTVDTTMTAQYFDGDDWKTLTITSDGTQASAGHTTLSKDGTMAWTIPFDWSPVAIESETGYAVRFQPRTDLTRVKLLEVEVGCADNVTISFPALVANRWTWVELPITPDIHNPDETKIVSIGLSLNANLAAQNIYIHGGLYLLGDTPDYIPLGGADENINALEAYGDERENPWVFTDKGVYEVQTQNADTIVPLPLKEIPSLRSETNGQAHTTSGVYLVFNLGQHIEKYYQHNLDDIGPDRDEGLPYNRKGHPVKLLSYPGRIFAAIDAHETFSPTGEARTSGNYYGSVLVRRESGWHEFYRAPNSKRMHDIHVQVIPGLIDRMWVSHGSDILWLPMPDTSFNPVNDSDFRFTHEGVIYTGWYTVDFLDIKKLYKSLKFYTENLTGTALNLYVDYQTESTTKKFGDPTMTWTALSDYYDTSPFEDILIKSDYSCSARRIRFRIRILTNDNTKTPVIKAMVLDALLRFPVKYSYGITAMLEDNKESLTGEKDHTATGRVEVDTAQLETWADAPTVLTWTCNFSPFSGKRVVLEPPIMQPIQPHSAQAQHEKHLVTLTLLEV